MSRTAIVVALVATFLIGASLGLLGGIVLTLTHHRPFGPTWVGRGPGPGMFRPDGPDAPMARHLRVLPRLREELRLDDDQVARIRALIEEAHESMGVARDSLRARIERVLTPEQRERMRRLEARRGFPGETRGPLGRTHRAQPGDEGAQR